MLRYFKLIEGLGIGLFMTIGLTYGSIRQAIKGHWGNAAMIVGLAALMGWGTHRFWRRWKLKNQAPSPTPAPRA